MSIQPKPFEHARTAFRAVQPTRYRADDANLKRIHTEVRNSDELAAPPAVFCGQGAATLAPASPQTQADTGSRTRGGPALLSNWWFGAIVLMFLLPGLVGHDPWKPDEAYSFGLIHSMLRSGDWVVPTLAGEPFMEKPPLFFIVATQFVRLFSPLLPAHDAARLATGFFMLVTCAFVGLTARFWWGSGHARFAVLALLGSLGLVASSHAILTDIAQLAGFSIAAYGFARAPSSPVAGGIAIGAGIGIGFLSKGLLAPGVLGITAILLPLFVSSWRTRTYGKALAVAALVAAPFLLVWPIALYQRSPALFLEWFDVNNVGRFVGYSVLGAVHEPNLWIKTLPWFTFPVLPLAAGTVLRADLARFSYGSIRYALIAVAVLMAVLGLSASARSLYALPLLVPLAILAAPAAQSLSPRLDRRLDWIARAIFAAIALFVWAVWIAMWADGTPPRWFGLDRMLPHDYVPAFGLTSFAVAVAMTVFACALVSRLRNVRGRALVAWTTGLALCWGLTMSLWLPWIDAVKNYRDTFVSLQHALPAHHDCIASTGLGEPQRALLDYFIGVTTIRREVDPAAKCQFWLEQTNGNGEASVDPSQWVLVWQGARLRHRKERYRLYERTRESDESRLWGRAGKFAPPFQ